MSETVTCPTCKGSGSYEALISQHDDKKESVICNTCKGKGTITQMSDEDERDYHADYW